MTIYSEKFWKKSWDEGLDDLDPSEWEKLGSLPQAFKKTFDNYPDKVAISYFGVNLTFRDIDIYSNQFAHMLIDKGLKKGDVVAFNLPNVPEYVIGLVGTLKAGCIVSGVSTLLRDMQIQYQLSDVAEAGKKVSLFTLDTLCYKKFRRIASTLPQLKLVITCNFGDFLPKIKQTLGKLIKKIPKGMKGYLRDKEIINFHKEVLNKYPSTPVNVKIDLNDLAFIIYTGGTTALPKGAMITHGNSLSNLLIVKKWLGWKDGEWIACSAFPFFHIAGLFFCECCLFNAQTQILILDPRDIGYICTTLAKYKPNIIVNVPSLYQLLLKKNRFKKIDFSNLEQCISSAAPFPVESQKQLEVIIGKGKLIEAYGMTETSPVITFNPLKGKRKKGSIGLPVMNTELVLMDPKNKTEIPLGDSGEIWVRGPQVMEGYYNKPHETEIAIDDDGFLHTGDVAKMDEDGYLTIVGRTKDMIIVSGYKVFSRKVEETIYRHPAIEKVAIIGIPNPERPGSEIVKAFIQLEPYWEFKGTIEDLKKEILNFTKERCSPFEVPKKIEIVKKLPITTDGFVDKKALRGI